MGAQAFDLADRLQTPIFVMLDLDIGMQEWLTAPFVWDDSKRMDRGKLMTHYDLEAGKEFGRYLDIDGDGISYRTWPGTHPKRGAFFTRGTSKDRYARYTEDGPTYVDNMQRLLRKFETAKSYVPAPLIEPAAQPTRAGVIWYGSTGAPMDESLVQLEQQGIHLDRMRIRAFPFADEVAEFIHAHEQVFVAEQNRDGQLRMLLINECAINPEKLIPILHYDGNPLTARMLTRDIAERAVLMNVTPLRQRTGTDGLSQRGAAD
jgi:2-oxoglutarate ferredoxin oxidoreductase subunit alpha